MKWAEEVEEGEEVDQEEQEEEEAEGGGRWLAECAIDHARLLLARKRAWWERRRSHERDLRRAIETRRDGSMGQLLRLRLLRNWRCCAVP